MKLYGLGSRLLQQGLEFWEGKGHYITKGVIILPISLGWVTVVLLSQKERESLGQMTD